MSIKCKSSSFKIELINTSVGWLISDDVFYENEEEKNYYKTMRTHDQIEIVKILFVHCVNQFLTE